MKFHSWEGEVLVVSISYHHGVSSIYWVVDPKIAKDIARREGTDKLVRFSFDERDAITFFLWAEL